MSDLLRSITPEGLRRLAHEMDERASFRHQFEAAEDLRRLAARLEERRFPGRGRPDGPHPSPGDRDLARYVTDACTRGGDRPGGPGHRSAASRWYRTATRRWMP